VLGGKTAGETPAPQNLIRIVIPFCQSRERRYTMPVKS
jgi:hypothetical protein